ncbi:6-phosphogluconolactonase [Buchnera aphidicola]|uniref:beta-propeller fold lactonase family protein n=1 Tax=Buchnera aphidicola TaxID=9 RepID=UPI0034648487
MKEIVYIAIPDHNIIEVWNLCRNGILKLIQTVVTDGQVQPINMIKNKNILYAGIRPNNRIIMYSIKHNGLLKKIHESSLPGSPNYIAFDFNNKFLFSCSYHFNCMSISLLNKNGIVQNPIQTIYNIKGCHAAKVNKKYNVLLLTSLQADCINLYYLTNNNQIKSTEQKVIYTQKNSGPRHISIHPNQDFVYTINELNSTIDVWNLYHEKNMVKIKKIQTINLFSSQLNKYCWASDIHITSCGRFLYAADRASNTIQLFYIRSDNNKIIFFKSYLTEEQPRAFCITWNNHYLIVTGQKSNTFTIYSISYNTGELRKLNTYNTRIGALWIKPYQLHI